MRDTSLFFKKRWSIKSRKHRHMNELTRNLKGKHAEELSTGCVSSTGLLSNKSDLTLVSCLFNNNRLHYDQNLKQFEMMDDSDDNNSIEKMLDNLPDSTFTRTISNPDSLMLKKQQKTLETKFVEILQHENFGKV